MGKKKPSKSQGDPAAGKRLPVDGRRSGDEPRVQAMRKAHQMLKNPPSAVLETMLEPKDCVPDQVGT